MHVHGSEGEVQLKCATVAHGEAHACVVVVLHDHCRAPPVHCCLQRSTAVRGRCTAVLVHGTGGARQWSGWLLPHLMASPGSHVVTSCVRLRVGGFRRDSRLVRRTTRVRLTIRPRARNVEVIDVCYGWRSSRALAETLWRRLKRSLFEKVTLA